ncbi:MAG: hypothetical protein ABI741_00770 [Ferruginibacter sp.]
MSDKSIQGKITFIHHEKNRAVIEYMENGKKRTIQADISTKEQQRLKELKIIKKIHRFLMGDQVTFVIKKTGANGSQQYASNLQYQYNTALELLINKAAIENKFLGYIKVTDGNYFIKEIDSYLFFPLTVSPYEIAPTEKEAAEPVYFKFENIEKPDKITAGLYNHNYIPEFLAAIQYFKKQTVIDATVNKITPFGIHLNLVNDQLQAKLDIDESLAKQIADHSIQVSSVIPVKIRHLSPLKIVVEKAAES